MLSRLARWWLRRSEARKDRRKPPMRPSMVGECICGKVIAGPDLHMVIAICDDDHHLGIEGSTAMSADFCAEHCPGGCVLGCDVTLIADT